MPKVERPAQRWIGEEDQNLHVGWSRSGKNVVLTIHPEHSVDSFQQVLLTPEQAAEVAAFLAGGPDA